MSYRLNKTENACAEGCGRLLGGTSFIMTIIFVTLKLAGVLEWAWWLVLSPAWGLVLFVVLMLAIAYIANNLD